jgi:hypothetical protein
MPSANQAHNTGSGPKPWLRNAFLSQYTHGLKVFAEMHRKLKTYRGDTHHGKNRRARSMHGQTDCPTSSEPVPLSGMQSLKCGRRPRIRDAGTDEGDAGSIRPMARPGLQAMSGIRAPELGSATTSALPRIHLFRACFRAHQCTALTGPATSFGSASLDSVPEPQKGNACPNEVPSPTGCGSR